jgi:hypothetical protein
MINVCEYIHNLTITYGFVCRDMLNYKNYWVAATKTCFFYLSVHNMFRPI